MKATDYFNSGFNCAQSVLLVLSESEGETCSCIPAIAEGFGSGIKTGSVCGAVTGAVMGIGLQYGRKDPEDKSSKTHVDTLTREFLRRFTEEHGTILCCELLGEDVTTEQGIQHYREKNLHEKCESFIATATRIAQTLLSPE
ncbi:MAG: C_GCAxxG_C_C family protein [Theionarchaea archaeon]|nr:C_GCAxxG_C_C family protein [Theionarchaea archaeon]MBU7001810.1 C_GCAxxG_C_C family protein [Theionarchaea archaeon]MBU7020455.1 C_GCAxxG_C_C family protein [Theionarchaea archaeon]MBU7034765.1 C_GCAxxG_C_C family protein [Theionarchaea archaeon]MBU7041076.1 C_GCAxxG_C_C family protein [Theionarchaea archaeon]